MPFIGSIPADLRAIVAQQAQAWEGRDIYCGCSGNFTVERTLASLNLGPLHSNDVSLYSCTIGRHLAGDPFAPTVQAEAFDWLTPYLTPGPPAIATLLLATSMLKGLHRTEVFFVRQRAAYRDQWETLHTATVAKIESALASLRVASFWAGDVVEFLETVPENAPFIAFPPTYAKGYERLYRDMDEVFAWEPPVYPSFNDERMAVMVDLLTARPHWLVARDAPIPGLEPYLHGLVSPSAKRKPLLVYSSAERTTLALPNTQPTAQIPSPRLAADATITDQSVLTVAPITQPQMNLLRANYLNPSIVPAAATQRFAVLVDGCVIGAMGFSRPIGGIPCDAYLMTDLAIRPTRYDRLSKLVLAAMLSREVQLLLERSLTTRVRTIATTAFTKRAVSSKYRGLFDLHSRKEDPPRLNYIAHAGRWSLEDGLRWWMTQHSKN